MHVARRGIYVQRLTHRGFAEMWRAAFEMARNESTPDWDSLILLEDDLMFAKGWLETLQAMQRGIASLGLKQGMTSCFRPHRKPQGVVVNLDGVEAYQSMGHSWHVNMVPKAVLGRMDVFEEALSQVKGSKSGQGIDLYYPGLLSHRLGLTSFVSMQSWVAHRGVDKSVVRDQGYLACQHPGVNLVEELSWAARGA